MSYVSRQRSVERNRQLREAVKARQARIDEMRVHNPITVEFEDISDPRKSVTPWSPPVVHLKWETDPKSGPYVPITKKLEVPKPQTRNRDGFGRRVRFPFGFFIPTPADEITNGFINVMNMIPGVAREVPVGPFSAGMYPGLPVYKSWGSKPWTSRYGESVLQDSRQTGQAVKPGKFTGVVAGPGSFISYYDSYQVWPSGVWRGDEQITFGPVPENYSLPRVSRGLSHDLSWGVLPSDVVSVWGAPSKTTPWPQGKVVTDTDTRTPRRGGGGPKRPDTLKWVPRRPPGRGMKERKVAGPKGLMALMQFLNGATEMNDLANAFYEALPEHLKLKRPTELQKKQQLYKYWNEVDVTSALVNAALNQLTDMIWAQLGINTKAAGIRYGGAMGANKVLSQAFGDAWKDVVDVVEATARKSFTDLTGHELRS